MEWPLVGRDRVLESTGAILASESTGGVVVTGAAGVGKTRLALELSRVAQSRGCAVDWVHATRSAASVPLGAFAPLLRAEGGGAGLLAGARQALVERAAGRRLVLCVDDGQLLDHASAALVHQLVAAGEAFAVVTLRRGDPAPDALRALWKDELCGWVELAELSRGDVEALLGAALGGPLDGPSVNGLWELTRGNVLFLRELVLYGAERGLLAEAGGIWRWRGEIAAGTRLAELVGARLDAVAGAPLEVVAVGAPLEVGLLDPGEAAALDALERHAIVERRIDGRRRYVDVAHPLYGEVVRARLSRTRQEAIQRRLADELEARGRRRADVPRLAAWRLESGGGDGELFERAAWQALAALDATLAERFARAAGGGLGARLALGRALAAAGRAEEADAVLSALEEHAVADTDRATVAIASARNLFWGLDRAADADAVLRRAERAVCDDRLRAEVEAQRVRLVAAHGRPQEALAAAEPLMRDPGVPDRARLQAAMAAAEALLASGRTAAAITVTETWHPLAQRHRDELPLAEHLLLSARAFALRFAGRLADATELAERTYGFALVRRSAQTTAVEAGALGFIWLARGRVQTALRLFRESAGLLRDGDAVGMLPWALAGLAQAAAQAGEPEPARAAVAELMGRPLGHKGFEPELRLARAWSAAAAGELTRARELARETSELAQSRGQHTFAVRARHELCRLGDPAAAAPALAALAARVDGHFAAAAAAHAAALVARDGPALLDAAEGFAELDARCSPPRRPTRPPRRTVTARARPAPRRVCARGSVAAELRGRATADPARCSGRRRTDGARA